MIPPVRRRPPLWPTVEEELLLKAALGTGTVAIDAWTAWRAAYEYDALGDGMLRLLPLLRANLGNLGISDPLFARMAETQRRSWFIHIQLALRLKPVLADLTAAGIETMLLKGLPLALAYYDAVDLRPIGDLDLMVRHRDWRAASEIVKAAGWRTDQVDDDPLRRSTHAVCYRDKAGFEFDLHHSPFHECLEPTRLEPLWQRAQAIDIQGLASITLGPTDQLLHCLAHGLRVNEVSSARWVADAVVILRRTLELDWGQLLNQAWQYRLGTPIAAGLAYLDHIFPGIVPAKALRDAQTYRPGLFERIEWFARRHEHLTGQGSRFGIFFRLHADKPLHVKLCLAPGYLADTFGTRPGLETLRAAGRKCLKALKGFF